tara:strand:+ start:297 stop:602 length:306 start_codon:yes stop_codon:yes gene_type:complete
MSDSSVLHIKVDSHTYKETKARLLYDDLKASAFINKVLEYYLKNDVDLARVVLKIKEELSKQNKKKRTKSLKLIEKGEKNKKLISLSNEEIKDLYDVLEYD